MKLDELFEDQKKWVQNFLLEQNPQHMITEEDEVMLMNVHRKLNDLDKYDKEE